MSVPTSRLTGSVCAGWIPATAVYRASLPMGMPMPPAPWSPRPRIRSLSVATMRRTSSKGALRRTSSIRPRWPGVIQSPRPLRKIRLYSWQAWPTVGVYTMGRNSSRLSRRSR